MRRLSSAVVLLLGVSGLLVGPGSEVATAAPPVHHVDVHGTGTVTYPAYSASVDRYGITTTTETGGSITVDASTSDPNGVVKVDGKPIGRQHRGHGTHHRRRDQRLDHGCRGYDVTVVDLPAGAVPGDGGHRRRPWAAARRPLHDARLVRAHGDVRDGRGPQRRASMGQHRHQLGPEGLRRGPGAVQRGPQRERRLPHRGAGRPASRGRHGTASTRRVRTRTDFHDSELLPGGRTLLVGYDGTAHPGQVDALIQIVDAAGHATFSWNSGDHAEHVGGLRPPQRGLRAHQLGADARQRRHPCLVQELGPGDAHRHHGARRLPARRRRVAPRRAAQRLHVRGRPRRWQLRPAHGADAARRQPEALRQRLEERPERAHRTPDRRHVPGPCPPGRGQDRAGAVPGHRVPARRQRLDPHGNPGQQPVGARVGTPPSRAASSLSPTATRWSAGRSTPRPEERRGRSSAR